MYIRRYEDLRDTPARFFEELREFLGIDTPFDYADVRANTAPSKLRELRPIPMAKRVMRMPALRRPIPAPLRNALRDWLNGPAHTMRPREYNLALSHYTEQIRDLGDLLDWDVSSWLEHR